MTDFNKVKHEVASLVAQENDIVHWEAIPRSVVSGEGHVVDTSGLKWWMPNVSGKSLLLNFTRVKNPNFRYALMRYCYYTIKRTSGVYAHRIFQDCYRFLLLPYSDFNKEYIKDFEQELIGVYERMISTTRRDHKLHMVYAPKIFYLWGCQYLSELGFNEDYGSVLEQLKIPGGPKGEAVKSEDVEAGPLHRIYELQPLYNAVQSSICSNTIELEQRAALALFIAHGRNPANLCWLRESDLINVAPGLDEPCWIIRYPRIKKKLVNPRDDFVEVQLPDEFAPYIQALIAANRKVLASSLSKEKKDFDRPLFFNHSGNPAAIASGYSETYFNYSSDYFTDLIQDFVARHQLVSPLTNSLLHVTPRRLRYTLATNLVRDGASQRQLAQILDHTDTQHVQVYFDIAGDIVDLLDKALIGPYAQMLQFFKGNFIMPGHEALNEDDEGKHIPFFQTEDAPDVDLGVCGKHSLCTLHPPYSCYKCPKFQAYINADHQSVLTYLLDERDKKVRFADKRIAGQMDEIIYAVAQVVEKCKESIMENNRGEDLSVSK